MGAPFYWAAWVGPRWTPATDARHFAWENLAEDAVFAPAVDTTLNVGLGAGFTDMSLTAPAGAGSKGGAWVGPNGSGQSWEYVEWSGKSGSILSGLTREDTATCEHNGGHSAGAAVRYWWPLANSNDGSLHVTRSLNDELSACDWEIEMAGVNLPRFALRNRYLVVLCDKTLRTDPWRVWAIGWIDSPQAVDDANRMGAWKTRIVSIAGILRRIDIPGVRVGPVDLAKAGKAQASSTLGTPWKESLAGDFVSSNPSFEARNVCDGDPNSLWICEHAVAMTDPDPWQEPAGVTIKGMQLLKPPTGESGYRWIHVKGIGRDGGGCLCDRNGTMFSFDGTHINGTGVFVENKEKFLEMYPSAGNGGISFCEIPSAFFDNLDLYQDSLAIYLDAYGGPVWSSAVWWWTDDWNQATKDTQYPKWRDGDGSWVEGPGLGGAPLKPWIWAPAGTGPMGALSCDWDAYGGTSQQWVYTSGDHLCYGPNQEKPWNKPALALRFPPMGIVLGEDVTASYPGVGQVLSLVDGGGSATGGLQGSGELVVGNEMLSYSAKVAGGVRISARGVNSTIAGAHAAGDAVLAWDPSGFWSDGHPLTQVGWRRYGGTQYPRKFKVWLTARVSPSFPKEVGHAEHDNDWEQDWTLVADVSGHAGSSWDSSVFATPRRARWMFIQFREMSGAFRTARPRINELVALAAESYYDSSTWLPANSTAQALIKRLLENAGVPTSCIDISWSSGIDIGTLSTACDGAWKIVADVAAHTGVRVVVTQCSRVFVVDNDTWTTQPWIYYAVYDRTNVARLENVWDCGAPASQVALTWKNPAGTLGGVTRYPDAPAEFGSMTELGAYLCTDRASAQAMAARRYWLMRFPYRAVAQLANEDLSVRPGHVVQVNWQYEAGAAAWRRAMLVLNVDQVLEQGVWTTVLTLRQLEREPFNG